jgi:Aldehyde dehydrogenase family
VARDACGAGRQDQRS